jgi:hypothetical protein
MKRNSLLLFYFILAFASTSCRTYQDQTPRTIEAPKDAMVTKKMIGELKVDVNKKLTGSAKVLNRSTEDAMNLAYWDAIEKGGAHAIVDPVYKVTTNGLSTTAEVSGYYAEFISIETATEQDLLDYIRVNLLTGTGILGVSFNQFKAFYYNLAEVDGVANEDVMEEWELRMFYDDQSEIARQEQGKSKSQDFAKRVDNQNRQNQQSAGKTIGTLFLSLVVIGGTAALISFLL